MNETWLAHHGIKGQKWGVRRFQNEDGSLTPAGEKRAAKQQLKSDLKQMRKDRKQMTKEGIKNHDLTARINGNSVLNAALGSSYARNRQLDIDRAIRDREVSRDVSNKMLEKYGAEKMSALKKSDDFRMGVSVAAVIGTALATTGVASYIYSKS